MEVLGRQRQTSNVKRGRNEGMKWMAFFSNGKVELISKSTWVAWLICGKWGEFRGTSGKIADVNK
jgi:hypothetical protein